MPPPGHGTTGPTFAAPGMSTSTELNDAEFNDWFGDSPPNLLEFIDSDADTLQSLEASRKAGRKGFLSPEPNVNFAPSATSADSPISPFQDSSSEDSLSTKRTRSTASAKTGLTSADTMMTDGPEVKQDYNVEDFLHVDDDEAFRYDGATINPRSIEQQFSMDDAAMENVFDFASATSSPSPNAQAAPTPEAHIRHDAQHNSMGKAASPVEAKPANRRHNKALSQYSLTQSMNGLKTNGSREVSPASNFIFSQDSSPSAFFNNSPSPVMNIDFTHGGNMTMTTDGIMPFTGVSPAQPPPGRPAPGMLMPNGIPAPLHFGMYPQQPMFGGQSPCKLTIDPIPLKSRVETQIPIKMRLSPLPPGIKRLHLPTHTISKPKLLAKPRAERSPDMLELSTMLVCTSAMQNPDLRRKALARAAAGIYPPPESSSGDDDETKPANGGEIWICKGCIQRERKRADRKKSKKPEEDETWRRNEHRRVIVFNTQEIKEWQNPAAMGHGAAAVEQMMEAAVDAPMRIACYCRHHGEKSGFQVIFTIKDCRDQVIAQAFSASIMITDDHKTHTLPPGMGATSTSNTSETSLVQQQSLATTPENSALSPGNSFRVSQSTSDLTSLKRQSSTLAPGAASQNGSAGPTPRNLSRPASPTSASGPSTKKRKSSGSTKVPSGLAMTRLETAQVPASQAPNGQPSTAVSKATSPFSPNIAGFAPEQIFAQQSTSPANLTQPFATGPPTPNSNNDQMFFSNNNRSASMDNLAMTQLYSAPTSTHPSRAPSPNGLRNAATAAQQQAQITQALQTNLFSMPLGMPQAPQAPSIIHKIIPGEGPKSGGIEVTILGIGFYQGLDVMFGDQKATTTTFWGERSLVCLVPPSPTAGHVLVTLKQSNGQPASPFPPNQQRITFKYIDDDEQHLLRTALTVLSKKMTGRFEDAQEVARRIIGTDTSSWGTSSGPAGGSSGGNYTGYSASGVNYESKLLKILELIDLDDSANKAYYNLCRKKTGQTMLHLACALGMHRFVAGLLARGAHPDVRDRCGYTPMHLAALNNQPEIVRRLIMAGADPTIRTLSGLTVAELAPSREVLLVIRRIERHARSRSGGSIHSRASSAASLKSLWEPPASQLAAGEYATNDSESADESPEYSENATTEDESSDEEHDEWLHMRRGSTQGRRSQDSKPAPLMPATDDHVAAGLGSPAATMMAFKDHFAAQIQQFQQAMALRVPNLPQFPYSLQMPHSWPESYQAYLNANPMFQRISSLVPNIGGGGGSSRPGSAAENNSPSKEMESRWWDLSSLMPSSGAPPPSYEEIFPQKDLDTKQATAAGAAAEAEADSKCAALYDESVASGSSSTSASASSSASQLPALLQIGRKNAITKEQQDQFRRVHAEKRKGLDADRKLFFIWIPVLLLILCATLYSRLPAALSMASRLMPTVTFGRAVEGVQERVVEVL